MTGLGLATRCVPVRALGMDFEILEGDSIIGPAIEGGAWEAHETRLFRAHLVPGCRVVDLGANVGWYSVLAVLSGAHVDAFEPVPEIAAVLERNVARAMAIAPGRAVVHRVAAGAASGTAQIAVHAENLGDNRVLSGPGVPPDMRARAVLSIPVEPVDALVTGPVRVLKIDTQGSEWEALCGARALIAASPRLALLLEFWPYALRGATPEALLGELVRLGFTVGKATAAPYPMTPRRLLSQARARDPVRGGLDLWATRGLPFHVLGPLARLRGLWRSLRE